MKNNKEEATIIPYAKTGSHSLRLKNNEKGSKKAKNPPL